MLSYKNLSIIGTSHIAPESVKKVTKAITEMKPQIVAVELDKERFFALLHEKKRKGVKGVNWGMITEIGFKGFLFNAIGAWVERKLGKMVGVAPGTEMKTAIALALQQKADIALIDQDIRVTIKRLFAYLTWKERMLFLWDITFGLVFRGKAMKIDLRKVPSGKLIHTMIMMVRKRYPSFYRALISERDEFMAKNLYNLMNKDTGRSITAVVGAGHEESILGLIRKYTKAEGSKPSLIEGIWNTQGVK